MKILFSSDLHGDVEVVRLFAERLRGFDLGILAGDLIDEYATMTEAQFYGVNTSEALDVLYDPDVDEATIMEKKLRTGMRDPNSENRRIIEKKREHLQQILSAPGKPVLVVTGNHDLSKWPTMGNVINIEGRVFSYLGQSFLGISDHFKRAQSQVKFARRIVERIPKDCIVVSHSPAYGTLDKSNSFDRKTRRVRYVCIGSKAIRKIIAKSRPKLHLFGHVHECFGVDGKSLNGAWALAQKMVSVDTVTLAIEFT